MSPSLAMNPPLMQQLAALATELRALGVRDLWAFGSAARGSASPGDVDLLVEFQQPPTLTGFMDVKFFLEEQLGVPVDLHTRGSCPERFIRRIEPDLLHVA